jgi:hypothetical protein
MTTNLQLQIGDRIAASYYGIRVEGTVTRLRGHTIRWDVREITLQFDEPTILEGFDPKPRVSMIVHDDWHGADPAGFSQIGWRPCAAGFSAEQILVKLDGGAS